MLLGDITNDSRVLREAKTLSKAGYSVIIVTVHNKYLKQGTEERDGYLIQYVPIPQNFLIAICFNIFIFLKYPLDGFQPVSITGNYF